jgi:hypothetical protein
MEQKLRCHEEKGRDSETSRNVSLETSSDESVLTKLNPISRLHKAGQNIHLMYAWKIWHKYN